ncbi:MAG: histone deacetylase [Verrucomicrobiota bacterium JB022]|nr:histone deacetylase [Verrucomicrobiota bacterium JB022]
MTEVKPSGVAVVYSPEFALHDTGPGCPEGNWRAEAVAAALQASPFAPALSWREPRPVEIPWLERVHEPSYRQYIEELCLSGQRELGDDETMLCERTYDIALLSAGSAVRAVDAVLQEGYRAAFSCARPPGHHALHAQGMGFCLFNNVAIAAEYACGHYGIERVAIIDWDVHHGNGTQEIFYDRSHVLFCSIQQRDWWPFTGEPEEDGRDAGKGLTVNVTAPPGAVGDDYVRYFEQVFGPAIATFEPQLIFLSAGFDAHRLDPLGEITLRAEDYARLTQLVGNWADKWAQGRLISVLEGGYDRQGLVTSATAHVEALVAHARRG